MSVSRVFSLEKFLLRSLHVAANDVILFFLMAELYSIVYMYHIFFITSSVGGYLGCFRVLTIVNSAVMNIEVHVSLGGLVFPLDICLGVGL